MSYVDVHAHLNDPAFKDDWEEALRRAFAAGVEEIIVAGYDLSSSEKAVAMALAFPGVYATVGVHPHEAAKAPEDYLEQLQTLARSPVVVAIGEIGLDYHYNFSVPEVQQEVFRQQLDLAKKLGLPVVVHDREAHADTLRLLEEASSLPGGIMHCYSGSLPMAERFIRLGLGFSFGGPLTFTNAHRVREVAAGLPRDRVMLETDCPYLTPVPHRGKRNEPAYLPLAAEALAGIWGMTAAEVGELTTANARRTFRLPGRREM